MKKEEIEAEPQCNPITIVIGEKVATPYGIGFVEDIR